MTDIKNMDNTELRVEIEDALRDYHNYQKRHFAAKNYDRFRAAWDELLSRMQGWVSVDTALPEEYTPVWGQLDGGAVNMVFYETDGEFYAEPLVEDGGWISAVDYSQGPLPVVRWQERNMPPALPQSPKGAK